MRFRSLKFSDFKDIKSISKGLFGDDYLNEHELSSYIDNSYRQGIVAVNEKDVIIGFMLAQKSTASAIINSIHKEKEWFQEILGDHQEIGIIKTIGIPSEFQQQGIGKAFLNRGLKILENTSVIIEFAWKRKTGIPMEQLFLKNGFSAIKEIKNFWTSTSTNCPECNKGKCKCSAIIFIKRKTPSESNY